MAESDASETQAMMVDDSGCQSVLVCPSNASSTGCAIYLTGVWRQLRARRTLLRHSCTDEAAKGAISGTFTGVLAVTACAAFTGPIYAAGIIGASEGLGAATNCAGNCFPGDASYNDIWRSETDDSTGVG